MINLGILNKLNNWLINFFTVIDVSFKLNNNSVEQVKGKKNKKAPDGVNLLNLINKQSKKCFLRSKSNRFLPDLTDQDKYLAKKNLLFGLTSPTKKDSLNNI